MKTLRFTGKETNKEKIMQFLEEIQDPNPFHSVHKVVPGMYYLKLLESQIKSPIARVHANFSEASFFEDDLNLTIEKYAEIGEITDFKFQNKGRKCCYGTIYCDPRSNKNTNEEKLLVIYLIGGELQRTFSAEIKNALPVYVSQTMEFYGSLNRASLIFENLEKTGKRDLKISMKYCNEKKDPVAIGEAKIKLVPEKTLIRMLQTLRH